MQSDHLEYLFMFATGFEAENFIDGIGLVEKIFS